ncbi:vWA domain-containing protein [Lentzea sp.]|uniref:vWA domain-containing protein n=1 Tax=Lentzea sp. TaxID=56099 RepID=UPI002C460675|nr:VWA domain-containing protein [Lentzea sp.]HUQ58316.1 VWA domain-containing protein [Lentzea sp.]
MTEACVGFTSVLRGAGLPCGPDRVQAFLRATEHVDLYWAGRLTLCADPDDLPRYDAAFRACFGGTPPRRRTTVELGSMTVGVAASDVEVLKHKDISEFDAAPLIASLRPLPPRRRSRRLRRARRGRLDLARTVRAMIENGGEIALPRHRRRGVKARRLVLLIDVSGSMAAYSDALLRFAHVIAHAMPVEVRTIGTRLTRVTGQLRERDPERAVKAAGRAIPDFEGGTRLGDALRRFNQQWRQRGAVVVLFTDGWERGDPALLAAEMARLRRVSHKVIWANPHAGKPGYRPVQSGVVAALPHVDRMVAGHSVHALEELLEEVRHA